MIEEKIKKLVKLELFDEDLKYFERAIASVEDQKLLERQIANHYLILDHDRLFANDIDDTIKYISELKEQGYTSISEVWYGYEDNGFEADKYEQETDDEYVNRLVSLLEEEIKKIKEKVKESIRKSEEIKRLENRIKELKSEL
jgi:basic membrane lipoprotein Med (substrate-binding protein (PBP1-ABC) superfamily)